MTRWDSNGVETGVQTQTDITCSDFMHLEAELSILQSRQEVLNCGALISQSFKGNDTKVNYHTGLPNWDIFSAVFQFVETDLLSERCALNPFQQLLMTLMRLRHNFSLQDLGYRFYVYLLLCQCAVHLV